MDALGTLIVGILKNGLLARWYKALFGMTFSAVVSYLVTNGAMLEAGKPELLARGAADLMAAGALIVCFVNSKDKLFKDVPVEIPNSEAVKALEADYQTLTSNSQEKKK